MNWTVGSLIRFLDFMKKVVSNDFSLVSAIEIFCVKSNYCGRKRQLDSLHFVF